MFNPELDEATATALVVLINNHIEAMKAWERKLRTPYLPTNNKVSYIYRTTPVYPMPTLATALAVDHAMLHAAREVGQVVLPFVKEAKRRAES